MQITALSTINFGYKSVLKSEWLKGNMPSVKYGIYGGKLTPDNITLEHIVPHSQGGKTNLANLALSVGKNNWSRGSKPFKKYFNPEIFERYLKQFEDVKLFDFDGKKYIELITKTVKRVTK